MIERLQPALKSAKWWGKSPWWYKLSCPVLMSFMTKLFKLPREWMELRHFTFFFSSSFLNMYYFKLSSFSHQRIKVLDPFCTLFSASPPITLCACLRATHPIHFIHTPTKRGTRLLSFMWGEFALFYFTNSLMFWGGESSLGTFSTLTEGLKTVKQQQQKQLSCVLAWQSTEVSRLKHQTETCTLKHHLH